VADRTETPRSLIFTRIEITIRSQIYQMATQVSTEESVVSPGAQLKSITTINLMHLHKLQSATVRIQNSVIATVLRIRAHIIRILQ
jgi:hypothetical protein